MPLHEFHCQECGADFELLLKEKDTDLKCPQCCSSNIEKKMSTFGSVFQKGRAFLNQCSPSS